MAYVFFVSIVILGNVVPMELVVIMAGKYDKETLKEILSADEYDVLVPEFIARASAKVSQAAVNIHECQTATNNSALEYKERLKKMRVSKGDPWYDAMAESIGTTMKAQASMWEATSEIQKSLATVTRRLSHT